MTDTRRDFLVRFAATALAAAGATGAMADDLPARPPAVVYGPPPPVPVSRLSGASVFFARDRSDLSPQAKAVLDGVIADLKREPFDSLRIEAHTDETGTREYDLVLGEREATAVKSYLVQQGLPAERMTALSYGRERPRDPGHSEDAQAANRRVDIIVTRR